MNIFEKMSAITNEISTVAKNLNVGTGKSSYKAVGEADVLSAVKPIEKKYNVYSYPVDREIVETNVLTTTSTYEEKTTEKNQLFMRVKTTYRFINIEKPDEYLDIVTYGDGVDSQDKAPGKAMTYADKYALLKAYKIETGDDPDQKASETLKAVMPVVYDVCECCGVNLTNKVAKFSKDKFGKKLCYNCQKLAQAKPIEEKEI